jgi:purine nucleosidase
MLHPAPMPPTCMAATASATSATRRHRARPRTEHAALAILRLSHEHAGKLLLVALGPLTNVALALKLDPTLPQRIARCVVMGGAVTATATSPRPPNSISPSTPRPRTSSAARSRSFELADWEAVMAHGFQHDDATAMAGRGFAAGTLLRRDLRADPGLVEAGRRGDAGTPPMRWRWPWRSGPSGAIETLERPLAVELAGVHTRGARWWTGIARRARRTTPPS